ncbi:glycoside hydrolase family 128 protein [Tulasnella calospora MUT 4182]|uniref:Glycoside hydrolase family 128 protein n=1 Tax=Tulasnella calospora MUT 4182 TaxID=1051891 RepID=A0A0C3L529_9AGAM|nr:glycoside hydrolase family 128 protein [Tulasnella calospora MUT 4182]
MLIPFTSRCYSWSPWSTGPGCEWVPMLWSGKQIGDWNSQVAGKTFKNVLAFNEPEISGQSEMSVGEAVDLWNKYIKPMNARHGAPAVTTSPKGVAWIEDFMSQCGSNCDIDFMCFHYYGMDPDDFIKTIKDLHTKFNKPIWVTEWACQNYGSNQDKQCSLSTIKSFMAETQAFLDNTSYIERYAWFGALTEFPGNFNTLNRLITTSGGITDLGRQYIAW